MSNHQRTASIPTVRLAQPLPPLPLNDIRSQPPKPGQLPPYRDVPEEGDTEGATPPTAESQPPGYEPMYDYLRSQQRQQPSLNPPQYSCPPDTAQIRSSIPPQEPYRDVPFIVTIDASQPPPPAYNEIYDQRQEEMQRLIREFDMDGGPGEHSEEICKWMVAMLIIALTVAAVGTAFNWGRPTCRWPNSC
jgi:hypothetical protein